MREVAVEFALLDHVRHEIFLARVRLEIDAALWRRSFGQAETATTDKHVFSGDHAHALPVVPHACKIFKPYVLAAGDIHPVAA